LFVANGSLHRLASGRFLKRQVDGKAAALPRRALKRDRAAHHLYQLSRNRQTQPRAAILPGRAAVGLAKLVEDQRMIFLVDPNPGVFDRDYDTRAVSVWADAC